MAARQVAVVVAPGLDEARGTQLAGEVVEDLVGVGARVAAPCLSRRVPLDGRLHVQPSSVQSNFVITEMLFCRGLLFISVLLAFLSLWLQEYLLQAE